MHKYLFLLCLFVCVKTKAQQNLVPNPGFEEMLQCPEKISDFDGFSKGWKAFSGTPDLFSACINKSAGVPKNNFGEQSPQEGEAYAGFIVHNKHTPLREALATEMEPMTIGKMYRVSFSVSRAENTRFATDNIGVLFFEGAAATAGEPQVTFVAEGVITDTSGWIRLEGYIVADAPYDHIAIGGFMESTEQRYYNASLECAYYYIDSVVVEEYMGRN